MNKQKSFRAFFLAMTFGLTATCWATTSLLESGQAEARGGGGHGFGGGFGGGFGDRGFGDRGYGDRGYGDRGYGGMGDADRYRDGADARPAVSDADRTAAADHTYGNALSTDGGFGRYSNGMAGHDFSQTHPLAQADLVGRGSDVRGDWADGNHPLFDRAWWDRHDGWWGYDDWGYGWWGGCGWDDLAGYWDVPATNQPVEYDYGNNITYQGDQVYYGSNPEMSTVQYYQQAQTLAASAPEIPTTVVNGQTKVSGQWKPLGVFALTEAGGGKPNTIFQLAVNKAGVVSGNYYNTLNDQSTPLKGKVDKKNMRVAWTVGKNKEVVYDTGLANLLEPQSTILVHLSKDKTQQEMLVRLDPPKSASPAPTAAAGKAGS